MIVMSFCKTTRGGELTDYYFRMWQPQFSHQFLVRPLLFSTWVKIKIRIIIASQSYLLRFSSSASFCSLISRFWLLNSVFRRSMSSTRDERASSCSFSSVRTGYWQQGQTKRQHSWQKAVQSVLVFIKFKQKKKFVNEPNLPTLRD